MRLINTVALAVGLMVAPLLFIIIGGMLQCTFGWDILPWQPAACTGLAFG
jgi:hypothetical protein